MGLFGNKRREFVVTTLLRHMEDGRFADALRLLRKQDDGPVPPPHVLWRLGRWSLDKAKPKLALFPLRLFLRLYPNHQDRPDVLQMFDPDGDQVADPYRRSMRVYRKTAKRIEQLARRRVEDLLRS